MGPLSAISHDTAVKALHSSKTLLSNMTISNDDKERFHTKTTIAQFHIHTFIS